MKSASPTFIRVDGAAAAELRRLTGQGGKVERLASRTRTRAGYYRILSRGAGLFLKVVGSEHVAPQLAAERVAGYLASRGLAVNSALPGYPKTWRGGHAVFAYRYVAARFAEPTEADMRRLGACLARLHAGLRDIPFRSEIALAWQARVALVEESRKRVLASRASLGPEPSRVRMLLGGRTPVSGRVDDGATQPLHGDVNHGNVLFPLDGSDPIVLDFEDASSTWGPTAADVARAVERFVLVHVEDDTRAYVLAGALVASYVAAGGRIAVSSDGVLGELLQGHAVRALCEVAELARRGRPPDAAEWLKFLQLYEQASRRADVLAHLEREFMVEHSWNS